ncbi:MAG: glycosyl hydrolase [Deltaproteobacteria bacterium]|nr:glycosyl hydrolase [Deltaproteobacteria bacterium]
MKEIVPTRPIQGPSDRISRTVFLCLLLSALAGRAVWAGGVADALDRPAARTRGPERCVLLDVTLAGSRVVAVGERGVVVHSDDGGKTWRQAKVPTSVSLTAVRFPTAKKGWATGHAGVVLHSEDGGETWAKQLEGTAAAKLALQAAQADLAARPNDAAAQARVAEAERLVADGPDKPFLALEFADEKTGYVVGAYNLIFRTEDAGRTWKPWMDRADNPKGLHLYAIRTVGKATYLAGEQGLFLRSLDAGASFQRLETPYKGTYFTLGATSSGELVLAGLRGNAYRTADQGKTFTKLDVPAPISLSAVATLADGRLLLVNQAGQLLESRDGGRTLQPVPGVRLPPVTALAQTGEGAVVSAGVAGVIPVPLGGAKSGGAR